MVLTDRNGEAEEATQDDALAAPPTLLSEAEIIALSKPADPACSGVYFLVRDGKVIYVGQSRKLAIRLETHARWKVFDRLYWIPCEIDGLNALESAYIRAFWPIENRDHTSRKRRRDVKAAKKAARPVPKPPPPPPSREKLYDPLEVYPNPMIRTQDVIRILDLDRPARQAEWMRRLRLVKANRGSVTIDDFGPSPFSLEWEPPGAEPTP